MPRFHNINGVHVPYTPEEEVERDQEEAANQIAKAARDDYKLQKKALEDKLAADTITDVEIRQLLRFERGLDQ